MIMRSFECMFYDHEWRIHDQIRLLLKFNKVQFYSNSSVKSQNIISLVKLRKCIIWKLNYVLCCDKKLLFFLIKYCNLQVVYAILRYCQISNLIDCT